MCLSDSRNAYTRPPRNNKLEKTMHVLFSDLICAGVGSVFPTDDQAVRFFDSEEDARSLLVERKSAAERIVSRELSIVVDNDYEGGVPYIFSYLLFHFPDRPQDTDSEIREQVEDMVDEFLSCDSIEDTTHVIEADKLTFEIPDRWQRENNLGYRWGESDLKVG